MRQHGGPGGQGGVIYVPDWHGAHPVRQIYSIALCGHTQWGVPILSPVPWVARVPLGDASSPEFCGCPSLSYCPPTSVCPSVARGWPGPGSLSCPCNLLPVTLSRPFFRGPSLLPSNVHGQFGALLWASCPHCV